MSDSNQISILIGQETNFGEARSVVAGNAYPLRLTAFNVAKTKTGHSSAEISRHLKAHRLGMTDVAGSISTEVLYDVPFKSLVNRALYQEASSTINTVTGTNISASSVDNSLNHAGSGFPTTYFPGDTILIAGFTGTTANNGYATVVSATTSKIIISGKTLVTDASGESVTISSETTFVNPGNERTACGSFFAEKSFNGTEDVAPYHHFSGLKVNTMSVKIPTDGFVTAEFGVMGSDMETDTDVLNTENVETMPISTASHMMSTSGNLEINGTPAACVTELNFDTNNNLATRHVVGSETTQNFTLGQFMVKGTFTAFFGNAEAIDFYNLFNNETSVSITSRIVDAEGNSITFRIPKVILGESAANTNGVSGEVTVNCPFTAIVDPTLGFELQVRYNRKLTA